MYLHDSVSSSRLFHQSILEKGVRDEMEERLESSYQLVSRCLGSQEKSDREVGEGLNREAVNSLDLVSTGLLVILLTEPEQCTKLLTFLTYNSTDDLKKCVKRELGILVSERWSKLKEGSQQQVVWLLRELVQLGVEAMDGVLWSLLRNLGVGGEPNNRNVWLAEQIVRLVEDRKQWVVCQPQLLAGLVYCFLRLVEDHSNTQGNKDPRQETALARQTRLLRDREATLVVSLMRSQFSSVLVLGRDLVRALQQVARVSQVEELWQQILHNPDSLCPGWKGVESLMKVPTPRKFLTLRITPDIERKLLFLTQEVKFGRHSRYEAWFQRSHLSSPDSQGLRADLVRYITNVIHPTNELLSSPVIPRWAVVGGLLTTCTSGVISAQVKLALFYDWMFFDPKVDNIMNIEPAALLMHHSIRSHPQVTATLLDFLLRMVSNFYLPCENIVNECVLEAWTLLLNRGVLPNLEVLFHRGQAPELKNQIMDIFSPLYDQWQAGSNKSLKVAVSQDHKLHSSCNGKETKLSDSDGSDEEKPAFFVFCDSKGGISKFLQLSATIGKTNGAEQGSLLFKLAESLAGVTITPDQSFKVAESLASALAPTFMGKMSDSGLEREISDPLFSLFHPLNTKKEGSGSLLDVIVFLNSLESRVGCFLLYYLTSVDMSNEDKLHIYTSFCKARNLDYETGLVSDFRCCQDEDVTLLIMLVPRLYDILPDLFLGNIELIYIVVSSVDSQQLLYLTSLIVVQRLVLLVPDSSLFVLQASLTWETFEQFMFWQIYLAHRLPLHILFQFLPSLEFKIHAEALTSVLLILKKAEPNQDIMKCLFQRKPHKDDRFLTSLLNHWMNADKEKLSEVLLVILAKHVKVINSPMRGNILEHSLFIIQYCPDIVLQPNLLKCFRKLKKSCCEIELQTYSDFFSSLEEMKVDTLENLKRKRRLEKFSDEDVARKAKRKKKSNNADGLI